MARLPDRAKSVESCHVWELLPYTFLMPRCFLVARRSSGRTSSGHPWVIRADVQGQRFRSDPRTLEKQSLSVFVKEFQRFLGKNSAKIPGFWNGVLGREANPLHLKPVILKPVGRSSGSFPRTPILRFKTRVAGPWPRIARTEPRNPSDRKMAQDGTCG